MQEQIRVRVLVAAKQELRVLRTKSEVGIGHQIPAYLQQFDVVVGHGAAVPKVQTNRGNQSGAPNSLKVFVCERRHYEDPNHE